MSKTAEEIAMKPLSIIISLAMLVSCTRVVVAPVLEQLPSPASDSLSDWQALQLAIAMTESEFKADAVGSKQDAGILQIRPIYVAEVNRVSGSHYTHDDAFDIVKSLAMFDALQAYYNPEHDIDKAIYFHNKSETYRGKVLENYELIKRMEAVRTGIKSISYDNDQY